jgi:superfamily II DNA or RNA helicase
MARRAATIVLRNYQRRIAASMAQQNTVVMLPTGSGKTLVAAEAMRQVGGRALFFVPTVLLVGQQATELRNYFTGLGESLCVGEFKGGSAFPSDDWSILVTTPDAFRMEQMRSPTELAWNTIQMCVFDEVHHVLKDHPYRKLALSLRKIDEKEAPRVGGLTASLTYAVTETGVNKNFDDICQELRVTNMETVEPGELVASGYHSKGADADVAAPLAPRDDVLPEKDRVAHLMGPIFFQRVQATPCEATALSRQMFKCVQAMEAKLKAVDPTFISQLEHAPGKMKKWGGYANKRAKKRAPECYRDLELWYEALRLLIVTWEEGDYAAVEFLRMGQQHIYAQNVRSAGNIWGSDVLREHEVFWSIVPPVFPRFAQLKTCLLSEARERGSTFRGILFVNQRVMTHVLEHFICTDSELALLFRPTCIYAASSPATASLRVTADDIKARLSAFRGGDGGEGRGEPYEGKEGKDDHEEGSKGVNLLIATVVAEEGMDIPAANVVIRFDAMVNSVSLVQGRGRARQENSSFIVLTERTDRPTSKLEQVEAQQQDIVRNYQPKPNDVNYLEREKVAQKSRERGALGKLTTDDPSLASLNLFCKKTKVILAETLTKSASGDWMCTLVYESVLRTVESDRSQAAGKKAAKRKAAESLFVKLGKSTKSG